jgi:septal ring factor EnvC (AmiA/AmiB activator)
MTELKELLKKLHDRKDKLEALIDDIEATIEKAEGQRKL